MLVDTDINSEKLKINIDVVMNHLPCELVSLDTQDVMGTHSVNKHGTLVKKKLNSQGQVVGIENDFKTGHDDTPQPDFELIKAAVKNKEGCQIVGNIEVLRVPGNFHISSHAYGTTIARLITETDFKLDITHTINHISFGEERDISHIKTYFNDGILNPIDGVKKDAVEGKVYEYYLKVVPTSYTDISGNEYNVHQFTVNNNDVSTAMSLPTIFFRYDISPILVRFKQSRQTAFHFFIQICAIVGGMFTMMGILDNLIHRITPGNKSD